MHTFKAGFSVLWTFLRNKEQNNNIKFFDVMFC